MKSLFRIILLIPFFGLLLGCQKEEVTGIITVNGPIAPDQLGLNLSHEHLLVDFIGADSTGYHRWNRDSVVKTMLPYLESLSVYSLNSFIDPTPAYLGRDPLLLKKLSEKSGLHILTNTGLYGARDNTFIPSWAFEKTPDELAELWIDEFEDGIENSGIKPGFIKIAVERSDTLSAFHETLVKAAALTQKATGMVIASHTGPDNPAFAQLAILEQEGVPAERFIWVHAQGGSAEGNIEAAQKGAWISLDNINAVREENPGARYGFSWYAERLGKLRDAGCMHRVLLSHDAGWYRPGEPGGGNVRGFTDIFEHLVPYLLENGFSQAEINRLLIDNPREAFTLDH